MHGNTAGCVISYLMCMLFLLLEKYFDMKKNQCKEGLDIYKKFLTRMTRISEFLKVAEVKPYSAKLYPLFEGADFLINQILIPFS